MTDILFMSLLTYDAEQSLTAVTSDRAFVKNIDVVLSGSPQIKLESLLLY